MSHKAAYLGFLGTAMSTPGRGGVSFGINDFRFLVCCGDTELKSMITVTCLYQDSIRMNTQGIGSK